MPRVVREGVISPLAEMIPDGFVSGSRLNHLKRFVRSASSNDSRTYVGYVSKASAFYMASLFKDEQTSLAAMDGCIKRFEKYFDEAKSDEPLYRVFYCDINTYLPEDLLACADRLSMHHSLEVRAPFLDHQLMEYCATIPPEMKTRMWQSKYLLKRSVSQLLPKEVLNHKKQGFVGPMRIWLEKDLRSVFEEKLAERKLEQYGLLNPRTVNAIVRDHYSGREVNDTLIWSLLVFQTWFERYMA